jgi:hypothetical protein
MTKLTEKRSLLISLLKERFASWYVKSENLSRISQLTEQEKNALYRLLISEIEDQETFEFRNVYYQDLRCFDYSLNQMAAELLCEIFNNKEAISLVNDEIDRHGLFFKTEISNKMKNEVVQEINEKGYSVSPVSLVSEQIETIYSAIESCEFITKGDKPQIILGKDFLAFLRQGKKTIKYNGDTYWLKDQDSLTNNEHLKKLVFDPYIISVITDYFGCTPIHVQTNVWFSLPSKQSKGNLSANAQLFHQDKEFIKFLKVFIYLTDVDETTGPHCYIESSHLDELHYKGPELSERITDNEIHKYYDPNRIKTLLGPSGMMVFGDTSCVHKGLAVKQGCRIMLQLEYASSLYLSPVRPFRDMQGKENLGAIYSNCQIERLTKNYNSQVRMKFDDFVEFTVQHGRIHKIKSLLKRIAKGIKECI